MIQLVTNDHSGDGDTVELFQIDGVPYRVPAKPRVNVGLQLLRDTRKHGAEMAQLMLLEKLLGVEAYDALCDYDDLTPDHLKSLSEAASQLTLGSLENASGNSESGPQKLVG